MQRLPIIHQCGRCARSHHGPHLPPGWAQHPRYGALCDDCGERLRLTAQTGLTAREAA